MKRYIAAGLAIILAFMAAAFTKPAGKPFATFTFHYTPTSYGMTTVQTNSNWMSGAGTGCGTDQNKACQMEVTDTYTHADGLGNRLLNDANSGGSVISIIAKKGANNSDYVPNPAASTGVPSAIDKP